MHAEHQDGKAHQNIPNVPPDRRFAVQAQMDPRHGDRRRQGRGREHGAERTRAFNITQAEHPAGDAGAENRPENHIDRLAKRHKARVDETDGHDRRGRGRLDHGRHAGAQQKSPDRGSAQLEEDGLELVSGDALQPVAHEGHAEQKKRNARQQTDGFQNAHDRTPFLRASDFETVFSIIRELAGSVKLKMISVWPDI